jgi:hypothetical protein
MREDTLDVPCHDGLVIQRTWAAVDACGHVTEITQIIIVGDKTPPKILVPSYSIIRQFLDVVGKNLVNLSQTEIMDKLNALDDSSVFVQDDCDQQIIPVFTLDVTYSNNCVVDGYFEHRVYTWVATDICGNSSSISFSVDIMDDIPPVLHGVPENTEVICQGLPAPPVVTADDPAQPVNIVYTQVIENGDGPGIFIVIRRWVATDACGNSSVGEQHIMWIPDTFLECEIVLPDMVECNSHGVLIGSNVSGGLGGVTYLWEIIGEKCFIQSGQGTPEILIYVGWTQIQIILTVTDAYGCSTVCTAYLDCVLSGGNPYAITPPSNIADSPIDPGSIQITPDQLPKHYLSDINLWPNPANGNLSLSFESFRDHEVKLTLMNLLGQEIMVDKMDARKGFNARKIDISKVPDGSYLMQIKSEKEMYSKVVVILHKA